MRATRLTSLAALQQCGIAVPGHRAAILRVLDYYRDPSAKGGTMDPSVFSIYQLEGEAISEEVYKLFQAYDRDGDGVGAPGLA